MNIMPTRVYWREVSMRKHTSRIPPFNNSLKEVGFRSNRIQNSGRQILINGRNSTNFLLSKSGVRIDCLKIHHKLAIGSGI